MSYPNIPDVTPEINLNRDDVINLLLASIAFEELGLAHIINAEAEKIQFVLGTLPDQIPLDPPPTLDEILAINRSVEQSLRAVIKKEMLLQFKLEDILDIPPQLITIHKNVATVTADFEGTTVTDSDPAYYYTVLETNNNSGPSVAQKGGDMS